MYYLKSIIPQSIKNIYHLFQAILANFWYGFPSRRINPHTNFILASLINILHSHKIGVGVKIIGVTGTNGKTTTVQMIAKILEEAGKKIAVASTINFKLNGEEWVNKTKFTTLSSFQVQKFIKKSAESGSEYLVLEISSHSLDQYRVWGIKYHVAVITNVTREHLDYHETMESYRKAKLKLFKKAKTAVINLDMENPEEYIEYKTDNIYLYSCRPERVERVEGSQDSSTSLGMTKIIIAENIKLGIDKSEYEISAQGGPASGWQNTNFTLNLPGIFNIENALAATCVGLSENIGLETIKTALEKIKVIPGRMDRVENNRGLNIIIDYAVTPDSLAKLYELIKNIRDNSPKTGNGSRIVAVFGACGERDRGKRPIMGEIVSKYADYIIITNEDPYREDPQRIIDEIFKGVIEKNKNNETEPDKSSNFQFPISNFQTNHNDQIYNDGKIPNYKVEGTNCWRILDRREAIKKALQIAKSGDFIIVTGKGAEETMAVGRERIPWNDRKVIEEELQKLQ